MALRDWEGFEARSDLVWNLQVSGSYFTSGTRGYWSRAGWRAAAASGARRSIPGTATGDLYFGFGIAPHIGAGNSLFEVFDSSGAELDALLVNGSGRLEFWRANPTAAKLATGTKVLTADAWYFIELHIVISDTAGVAHVKVDEVTDINASSLDTKPGTGTTMDSWGPGGGNFSSYDDFYCDDAAFQGDCGVPALFVTGAGDATQLTPVGSGTNWQNVDDVPHDSDTSYNHSSTIGDRDLYALENLPAAFTVVKGVKMQAFMKKNDAGAASGGLGVKYDSDGDGIADTEWLGADQPLSTDYALYEERLEQDPGATGWTAAEVNALQAKVAAR